MGIGCGLLKDELQRELNDSRVVLNEAFDEKLARLGYNEDHTEAQPSQAHR